MSTEVTADLLRGWPLPSPAASEKHSRGVALVVAGSASTPGTARLAAEAALRVGCGKVRVATASSAAAALAVMVPEARVFGFDEAPSGDLSTEAAATISDLAAHADATLIGPGFVDPGAAADLVAAVASSLTGPVMLDALASAYVGAHPDLADLRGPCVLTVNPSELALVLDVGQEEIEADPAASVSRLAEASGAARDWPSRGRATCRRVWWRGCWRGVRSPHRPPSGVAGSMRLPATAWPRASAVSGS